MARSMTPSENASECNQKSQSQALVSSSKIIGSFNTWAFKRQQPSDAALLDAVAARARDNARPLPFILYWGKGPRSSVGRPEQQCLDFLAAMGQRVAEVYAPGAHFELLLTDTHAELNGHHRRSVRAYFADVTKAAAQRGFTTRYLSSIATEFMLPHVTPDVTAPSPQTLSSLEDCAGKWYRGEGLASDGAAAYYSMNMREKRAVESCYPDAIFVTFNSSTLRILFPDLMPIFYMYSLRKGCAIKPWFMDDVPLLATATMPVKRDHPALEIAAG